MFSNYQWGCVMVSKSLLQGSGGTENKTRGLFIGLNERIYAKQNVEVEWG